MRSTINNAEPSFADLTLRPHQFNALATVAEQLLARVDIMAAIDYYGITELLDAIGEEKLKAHLECLQR